MCVARIIKQVSINIVTFNTLDRWQAILCELLEAVSIQEALVVVTHGVTAVFCQVQEAAGTQAVHRAAVVPAAVDVGNLPHNIDLCFVILGWLMATEVTVGVSLDCHCKAAPTTITLAEHERSETDGERNVRTSAPLFWHGQMELKGYSRLCISICK